MSRDIKRIFIHCTATSQKATLQSIRNGWRARGWKNPGYHVLVFPDGYAAELLPIDQISNGVAGYNATGLHICYVGGIGPKGEPIDNRTEAQKHTIEQYLRIWHKMFPVAKILGHRDVSPDTNHNGKIDTWEYIKWCPCFSVVDWLKEIHFYETADI